MRYICKICGYVYDEEESGPWNELPEDWKCPLCGAGKESFRPEAEEQPKAEAEAVMEEEDIRPLSNAEISILRSNLAKGCEKQYLPDQAAAFTRLSEWFRKRGPEAVDPSFEALLEKIDRDLSEGYPQANAAANAVGDRGALRSLVWSEKVTMILQSLLSRSAGTNDGQGVYVCTICGFIYVGNELPERCPVCKVPNFKFRKIGG